MAWAYNVRVLAIFAVVVLHTAAGFVGGVEKSDIFYGSMNWWAGNMFDSITRWCVPVFVMISGYFLLNSSDNAFVFFKKRFGRIFYPLAFWSILFSGWVLLKLSIKGDLDTAHLIIAKGFLMGRPYYHLWFLFMIPFLYAATPYLKQVLVSLGKEYSFAFICFAFLLSAFSILFKNLVSFFGVEGGVGFFANDFLLYIGYFMLGGYIKRHEVKLNPLYAVSGLLLAWSTTVVGSYFFTYEYFYNYLSFNTIIASVCIFFCCYEVF
ncbi:acyltransferase [Cobetia crustatorum]|uniref:acyltransferase n=1 Tax=Cobetia crustatorum TaxID=553385 RepID=UPI000687BE91|nr:acyltransferase family protein [Cobetia crustatorum]